MGCGGPSKFRRTHEAAWGYLLSELRPDVALVQEALIAASDWMNGRGTLLMSDDKNPTMAPHCLSGRGLKPSASR
jgi:hypothetical protein